MKVIKVFITALTVFIFSYSTSAQDLSFEWGKSFGSEAMDKGRSVAIDSMGNVFVAGVFEESIDFDTVKLTPNGSSDAFIQKLDSSGCLVWIKQFGGDGICVANSIALDTIGNIYATGFFWGTIDFDPSKKTKFRTSNSNFDMFTLKLDTCGNLLWVEIAGGNGQDKGKSILVDNKGNVYTLSIFEDIIQFKAKWKKSHLLSEGGKDIFIQKLNSKGKFVWAKRFGNNGNQYHAQMAIDSQGALYLANTCSGIINSNYIFDNSILKLDSNGKLVWHKQLKAPVNSIAIDNAGYIILTGTFTDTVDIDPGPNVNELIAHGKQECYVLKLDFEGGFVWAKQTESAGMAYGNLIVIGLNGDIYTVGGFSGTTDFDHGSRDKIITSTGLGMQNNNVFIQKMNKEGELIWVSSFGNDYYSEGGTSIAVDHQRNIYLTGYFLYMFDMDPTENTFNVKPKGQEDIFIIKLKDY